MQPIVYSVFGAVSALFAVGVVMVFEMRRSLVKHGKTLESVFERLEDTHRFTENVERDMYSEVERLGRDSASYTDSRFDQLVNRMTSEREQ